MRLLLQSSPSWVHRPQRGVTVQRTYITGHPPKNVRRPEIAFPFSTACCAKQKSDSFFRSHPRPPNPLTGGRQPGTNAFVRLG